MSGTTSIQVRRNTLNMVAEIGEEASIRKILNWGYNETLFHIWADDEVHGQLLVMLQSPCKRTKTQCNKCYKFLSLSTEREYFVPKIAQIVSSCNDLKAPSPLRECNAITNMFRKTCSFKHVCFKHALVLV